MYTAPVPRAMCVQSPDCGQGKSHICCHRTTVTGGGAHGLDPIGYASVVAVPGKILRSLIEPARAYPRPDVGRPGRRRNSLPFGDPAGKTHLDLLDVARQYEAGLIVIGTKGKQGAGPIVVGAVAGSVLTLIGNYRRRRAVGGIGIYSEQF